MPVSLLLTLFKPNINHHFSVNLAVVLLLLLPALLLPLPPLKPVAQAQRLLPLAMHLLMPQHHQLLPRHPMLNLSNLVCSHKWPQPPVQ